MADPKSPIARSDDQPPPPFPRPTPFPMAQEDSPEVVAEIDTPDKPSQSA